MAVPLPKPDMEVKHDYKGFGSTHGIAAGSKWLGHDKEHDRNHREGRQLIHNPIEFCRVGVLSGGEIAASSDFDSGNLW